MSAKTSERIWAANRLGLDYETEAARLGAPVVPITDIHSHINGAEAARIYDRVRRLYGVSMTYSMTQRTQAEAVREVLGESIRFIAVPSYMDQDRGRAMREGFLEAVSWFRETVDARIVKFWAAPRSRDLLEDADESVIALDGAWRVRVAELAESLGMMFMVHIADPDTWFKTHYKDSGRYGTKQSQYMALERMLDRFGAPWIAAHMGGWPENLEFLDGLLGRHDNLYLDTSATKWMVRELSTHEPSRIHEFLERWSGRVLFGSDIVTTDEHLQPDDDSSPFGKGAVNAGEAFQLYASRYWALRTMWETGYDGESNIADPDLKLVDPDRHDAMSAPALRGKSVPPALLHALYRDGATRLMDDWMSR